MKLFNKNKKRRVLSAQERANELLNSKYNFGRITTAESKSVDYSQYGLEKRAPQK